MSKHENDSARIDKSYLNFWYNHKGVAPQFMADLGLMFKRVLIEMTDYCPLKCDRCNRACNLVDDCNYLTVEQVKVILDEMKELSFEPVKFSLQGGEPTDSPFLIDIIKTIHEYFSDVEIHVYTNGLSEKTKRLISLLDLIPYVTIQDSAKTGSKDNKSHGITFEQFTISPDSLGMDDELIARGCKFPYQCGVTISATGLIYPCPCGGIVDKVFYDSSHGFESLKDYTLPNIIKLFPDLCKYCGRLHGQSDLPMPDISLDWFKALKEYNSKRSTL